MDTQTIGIIIAAVAVVAAMLYVWDRRSKQRAVDYADATKIAVGAGSIAGGFAYAMGGDTIAEAIETVTSSAQEMFVGKPEF